MKSLIKRIIPKPLIELARPVYDPIRDWKFKRFGRPHTPGESSKANARRQREGFFDKFCKGRGLDIGYGGDLLTPDCTGWDYENGDAQYLNGIKDASFDFVYSSHTIEHMVDPQTALHNWWRVVKPGGHLIVYLPHRDLYEKKMTLPSRWNDDHKHFFMPDADEPPDTLGVRPLIERSLPGLELVYLRVCDEGWTISDPEVHSNGEYSIEFVAKKL